MRSLRGAMFALGSTLAVGVVAAGAVAAAGCSSGNSSTSAGDSGADVTSDVTMDSPELDSTTEAATDTSTIDVVETSTVDSGSPPGDASDSGNVGDANVDASEAGLSGLGFAIDEATAVCKAYLACCPANPGGYDMNACIVSIASTGWENSLPDTNVYGRGHTTIDPVQAAACLAAIPSFPCTTQTAAQWGAITAACELVIKGTIPSNTAGCVSSFECAQGNYCNPNLNGGTCVPLVGQGQPCDTNINSTTPVIPDQMCNYLGSGQPGLFCDLIDNGPDAATCQPLLANTANCYNATTGYFDDLGCTPPGLCGDNLQCGGTASYPYSGFCSTYAIVDAGTD